MVVSDSDNDGFDDESDAKSIPPSDPEGEIHATDGDLGVAEVYLGENDPVQPPSPQYP